MFNNNKILVVIPARDDSKGIPRKNARLLGEKPIISYTIETSKNSKYVDDVVVASDNNEIIKKAERAGANIIRFEAESREELNLEKVVHESMIKKESLTLDEYDIVITILPTNPLLKVKTLDKMIERFENSNIDTIISVKGDRELYWVYDDEIKGYKSLYPQRENLGFLPKTFKETGNFIASRRSFITPESIIGSQVDLFEVSREERVHIDTYEDWGIATNYLKKKKIAFVVDIGKYGSDNIYRCLSISSKIFFHDILFLLEDQNDFLENIVEKYNYPYKLFKGTNNLMDILNEFNPDIIFNDIGDTAESYIAKLKEQDYFVVNFRDCGSGYPLANLVFDDLYEHKSNEANLRISKDYFILKDSFYSQTKKAIYQEVNQVLVFFEGDDSNNLSERLTELLIKNGFSKYIHVVLGSSYPFKEDFKEKFQIFNNVIVYENANDLNDLLFKVDMAICSAGRAMYEACVMNVPSIIICQNERELTHSFANVENGFINLGLHSSLSDERIMEAFTDLYYDFEKRYAMHKKMKAIDLGYGFHNLWHEIQRSYRDYLLKKEITND